MPPSQLKRLKASLRDQGITGAPKSKKQKKKSHGVNADQRNQRQTALQGIRDAFNPFEVKAPSRPSKFESYSNKSTKSAVARPGVTRSLGEEARRQALLPEIQRRHKVGGVVDRRIGENDPTLTPEERALQRYAREKERKRGASMFDLEEADEEDALTHMGQALDFDGDRKAVDDFDADGVSGSDDGSEGEETLLKRKRPSIGEDGNEDQDEGDQQADGDELPARKRSKKEVMEEVMAKSKLYKYERQKAKEDDDELREELDKGVPDILALLRGQPRPLPAPAPAAATPTNDSGVPTMNPERLAMLNGVPRDQANKEYDARLRQMAMDQRAAPTDKTKTVEEKAADEAKRLRDLEESRLRRMRGEDVDEEEDEVEIDGAEEAEVDDEEDMADDAKAFGFSAPVEKTQPLVLDDEDEFEMEDDLIASQSEAESEEGSEASDSDSSEQEGEVDKHDAEEDEFVRGILDGQGPTKTGANTSKLGDGTKAPSSIAYSYPCPQSQAEFLSLVESKPIDDIPTIVQRIRAIYHPSLSEENKKKVAKFSAALVDHIAYMGLEKQSLPIIEKLTRHIHSLSRIYPETIASAFRAHLLTFHRRGSPTAGDCVLLTAIGSIYPTSDHFHQVVTPAITLMARWLVMNQPSSASESQQTHRLGAFLVSLCLHYQRLSKRFIPEAVRFTVKALQTTPRPSTELLEPHIANLSSMLELWLSKSAFTQVFTPSALTALTSLKTLPSAKKALSQLQIQLSQARLRRRPLELHHHRPLAIRTSIPKFEEGFNPDKHYDPDRERADASKLRKEYKRERKGALRELRKDANFVAREQLRDKRERDAEYDKKYKRLVAEIQGTEGHEANEYERQKRMRKGGKR